MVVQYTLEETVEYKQNDDTDHSDGENRNGNEDIREKFETKGDNDEESEAVDLSR